MFAMKKLCSMRGGLAYRFIKPESSVMVFSLQNWCNPILKMLSIDLVDYGSRFYSSKRKKPKDPVVLNLAYQAYAVPYESDETIPIIIVHGLLGSKSNWHSMAKALLKGTNNRMVIAVDIRNHGDSPHVDDFSYDVLVSDMLKFMYDRGVTKASFVGHSLGGRICMLLALMYPQMVHSLVVVDISPFGQSPNMMRLPKLFKIIKGLYLDPYYILAEARKQATIQLKEQKVDDKLISFLMTNLVEKKDGTNWRWKFNINSILKNFESEICKFPFVRTHFPKRTLFVAGADSDYLKQEDEGRIKSVFAEAQFVYITGAGHWVHAEKPDEFLTVVKEFLNHDEKK